jgi:pilus assembly protein CpaE
VEVTVLDRERQVSAILAEIVGRDASVAEVVTATAWDDLRRAMSSQLRPVVVLGPSTDEADLALVPGALRDHPGASFVQVTDRLEVETLQRAMRSGVREVVPVGEAESGLMSAIERAHSAAQTLSSVDRPDDASGTVVTVFGTKGGTGKTLVATNLAALAARSGIKTALVDANVWFGDCAAALRVRPQRTLTDLAGIAGPIDESALGSTLSKHETSLRVLCAPTDPLEAENIQPSVLTRVIEGLRRSAELTVVDTGSTLDGFTIAALAACERAYLVTSLELTSVKDAKLALSLFRHLDLQLDKVRVVLNRANSNVGFPADEVSKALGRRVSYELPSDVAVPRSINNGIPVALSNPKAKVSRSLRRMVQELQTELLSPPLHGARSSLLRAARARPAQS